MGAVAGHMSHLYDNPNLTFGKMKDILKAASDGDLDAEEKVDGQNLFLSYSLRDGKAKGARNKGNLRAGGLDATGLAQKFAGRGNIEQTFTKGFSAFEEAVESLSDQEKLKIFGPDANHWYNAEIMNPGSRMESGEIDPQDEGSVNVIKYDDKTLKIHDVGHFKFNKDTGEREPLPPGALQLLDSSVERMQEILSSHDFNLVRRAAIQLNRLDDDEALRDAVGRINEAIAAEGLSDANTIQDYLFERLKNGFDGDLSITKREELARYLLKMPGNIGLRAIKMGVTKEDLKDITEIVNNSRMILKQAIEPIENAIHDFSVEILKGLESRFIVDNRSEVERIRKELSHAVKEITAQGKSNPQAMEIMQQHLNKIKDFQNINTPMEGIVFVYDDYIYKFTGNFAPVNQILGMFKYPRAGKTLEKTNEGTNRTKNILNEKEEVVKTDRAERFVMSLPKFAPSEAWGDPNSMERKQIQRLFDTVGGGATINQKLEFLNKSIDNPSGRIRSPRRIISTLILLESLSSIIRSFNEASAGFIFEGFLAGLLRGKQVAGRTEKGNLPIQDLIAFTELGNGREVPISLKLLNQRTLIEGSYTNLIDSLEEFGEMVYIVGRKDGDRIALEKFTFDRDNFINALALGATGKLVKEKNLFTLPGKTPEQSIKLLNSLQGDQNWPEKYDLLQITAGYDPQERARKEREKEKQQGEEKITVSDEMPDGEDVEVEVSSQAANIREYSVDENRILWEQKLLTESSQRQWSISPQQLKAIAPLVDYDTLGSLPYSSAQVVSVAKQYMKYLSDNLLNVFEATKDLSEEITQYFTKRDRSQAITSGEEAIKSSNTIGREMTAQISQDQQNEHFLHEEQTVSSNNPQNGKKIAIFPGKFKPPHRGHYEMAVNIANKLGPDGEVVVLISPVSKPEVSNEQALEVWNKYLDSPDAPDNIHAEIADYRSPVTTVYEFVADPVKSRPGDTIFLIKSDKDVGDTRFNAAQSYAERHNPGVTVSEIEAPAITMANGEEYHGGTAREHIKNNNREGFDEFVPPGIDTDEIWNIFYPNAGLDAFIDENTMGGNTMSAGSVAGSSGGIGPGFGPPNSYDAFSPTPQRRVANVTNKRNKRTSSKLKRAKRKRRG